jgi:iduronate 2-sulfatase
MKSLVSTFLFLFILFLTSAPMEASEAVKPNVLFISVDDLKPLLGCYGDPIAKTPNMDRIAREGILFQRAYCQQAVCNPSRASVMTGMRPDTTKVYNLTTHFREHLPDVVTLPQLFKNQGYYTRGFGKVYHGMLDDKDSWSVPFWKSGKNPQQVPPGPDGEKMSQQKRIRGLPWHATDRTDGELPDGDIARMVMEVMNEVKEKPFFLSVGFYKPHLPFIAPRKYWDLYDPAKLPRPNFHKLPEGTDEVAASNWGELRQYYGMPKEGPLTAEQHIKMIHGYYAAISFIDAQVGKLLDELDRLKLRERTVIVLWSDHGWHLGDHGLWCKHTNFEQANHSVLMMSAPGLTGSGQVCGGLVELVDIYPTVAELCGLEAPKGLEGLSLKPLMQEPGLSWKKAVFSQYPHGPKDNTMGRAIRTLRHRLVKWEKPGFQEIELYDYVTDPDETRNLAGDPAHKELKEELLKQLAAGWKAALPNPENMTAVCDNWKMVFEDDGVGGDDWKKSWFLDGQAARVERTPEGLILSSGSDLKDNSNSLVLWTRQSFTGDVKVEYDYTRLDDYPRGVNIIYLLATGKGEQPFRKDIYDWADLRVNPKMNLYWKNMKLLHISYAVEWHD